MGMRILVKLCHARSKLYRNSGKASESGTAPIIGDNVDIGVGATIIGNITIADNIKIGAGAVVTKSF